MAEKEQSIGEIANELASGLQEMAEAIQPIFEAAQGMRARMEENGWSPTIAEQIAAEFLLNNLRRVWTG